jgi:hypothetical protein
MKELYQGKLVKYKKSQSDWIVGKVCGVVQTEFFNLVILEILEMHGNITGFYPFSHFLVLENQLSEL